MKCFELVNLLLLIIYLFYTTGAKSCSFDSNIKPDVVAVGWPVGSIRTTWKSVNSTGRQVLYRVHYNRTSIINSCEYPTTDALYTAEHCSQNSTGEGHIHECDLTEEVIKKLNIDFLKDSLCILISMKLPASNETCYSLFKEYSSWINEEPICPAPELKVLNTSDTGNVTVTWNVSPKFVGNETLKEMSFIINFEPLKQSNACSSKEIETRTLTYLHHKFSHQNNTYVAKNLVPCCPYKVTICCKFSTVDPKCNPGHMSDPIHVTIAEQEPARARVAGHEIPHESLIVKWMPPSNKICNDKIAACEIQYWEKLHNNCSSINSILTYISNRTSDKEAHITGISSSATYCFRIRMWTRARHGRWSRTYSTIKKTTEAKPPQKSSLNIEVVAGLAGFGTFVLIGILIGIIFIIRKNRQQRPLRLDDAVGDLEPATDLLNYSQSSELDSLNNDDYATA